MAKPTKVVDDDDTELDEVDDDNAPKAKAKAKDEIWGVRNLIALIKAKTDVEYKPREVRALLRRMAGKGQIDREIVAGNKDRYSWTGPSDPEVKAIIKAVSSGDIEKAKKEALDKLKARKVEKDAEKAKAEKPKKKKPAPPADDEDDDD